MSDDFELIDGTLRVAVDDGTVLGVTAMGATSDGLAYQGFFGNANIQVGTPMAPDTVFWLLSMTKTFTAVACMQLIEQGKLDPEQSAGEILPQLASPRVLDGFDAQGAPILRPAKRPITVRHLLTHTSGYTYPNWSQLLTRYEQVTDLPDIANLQNMAFEAPLEFDPGGRWEYGIGMDWIGKIIEEITDLSLEVYFRENIFEPLGMKDSGFLIGSDQRRRVATMAARQADGSLKPEQFEIPQRPEFFSGGGGAYSTPQDYLRILQALLNDGTLDGVQILRPDTVAQMRTNQIGDLDVHEMRTAVPAWSNNFDQFPGQRHKWGFSFDINETPGPHGRAAGSISWSGLLNCHWWVDPVKKVTGALFTQVRPFYDERIVSLFGEFESGLYRALQHPPASISHSNNPQESLTMNANQEPHSLRETLIGAWELVSCTEVDIETNEVYLPMGETPVGFILYTPDGYMSAQLSAPDRANFADDDMYRGTPDEYTAASLSYLAYSGPYHVDEASRTVEHGMRVSAFPNWTGERQLRLAELDGDQLTLRTNGPSMFNGSLKDATIVWRRAKVNT